VSRKGPHLSAPLSASRLPAAVIFDVDGTLVDSERHGHRVAFNMAFAEFGLPYRWDEHTYGQLLRITGGSRRIASYLLEHGYSQEQANDLATQLHARKTERFRQLATEGRIPARPGTARLLDELAAAKVPVAVATTGTRSWVEPLLERLFGLKRFTAVVTGTEVPDLKPEPAVYFETLKRLKVRAAEVLAVEDSANGLAAAQAAAVPCLVVVNDYTSNQNFDGAVLVVDAFGAPGRARVLAGPADALEQDAVTLATLTRLLQAS
jgi:HAD superfamily hydrolase (TIGR01509 family)